MQRRDFLMTCGGTAALLASNGLKESPSHAGEPRSVLSLSQIATDRFRFECEPDQSRTIRLLQITDTHFGSPSVGAKAGDRRSFETITSLVKQQQPDLIVHTGDFINNDQGPNVSFEAVEFMDGLGAPWTHCLGNHDIGAVSTEDYRKKMKRAVFGHFDSDAKREYAFRIDFAIRNREAPGFSIFCFDSGSRVKQKHVSRGQLDWFNAQLSRDREQMSECPALAMIHIPMIEFDRMLASEKFRGIHGEKVCYESDTGETFSAFEASHRVRGVFSGHDHMNDYSGPWNGIELVYGRVSGWSAYGDLPRGGRLIELDLAAGTHSHRLVLPVT